MAFSFRVLLLTAITTWLAPSRALKLDSMMAFTIFHLFSRYGSTYPTRPMIYAWIYQVFKVNEQHGELEFSACTALESSSPSVRTIDHVHQQEQPPRQSLWSQVVCCTCIYWDEDGAVCSRSSYPPEHSEAFLLNDPFRCFQSFGFFFFCFPLFIELWNDLELWKWGSSDFSLSYFWMLFSLKYNCRFWLF